jgi:hypothetical protein
MIPKKPAPDLIRGGNRFSEKIMLKQKASVPIPKFATPRGTDWSELRNQRGTSTHRVASVAMVQKFARDLATKYGELRNRHTRP